MLFIKSFRKWFQTKSRPIVRNRLRRKSTLRLHIEALEGRLAPAGLQPNPTIFQPEVAAATPINTEGQVVRSGEVLLQFADSAGSAALTHLTATVTWGDGTSTTPITSGSTNTAQIIDTSTVDGSGNEIFQVVTVASGAKIYDEVAAGTNYSVNVADDGFNGPASNTGASTPVNSGNGVADAALTDTTSTNTINGTEGNTLNNVVIATFDDANPSAPLADYTVVSVTYGGSPAFIGAASYSIQANGVSGGVSHWQVVASNLTFAEKGTYTVASVKINDEGGSSLTTVSGKTTFNIADANLTDTTPSGNTANAVEGTAFTNLGLMTFDDANPSATVSDFNVTSVTYTNSPSFTSVPTYQVQVNGTPSGGFSHWKVVVSGTVAEPGNFTATVNVADADGQTASTSNTTLAVADGALTDTTPSGSNANAVEGNGFTNLVLMTFDDANASAAVGDYTVTPVTYSGAPSFTSGPTYLVVANGVSGGVSHWKVEVTGTIAEKGNYTATVHVADTDGSTASSSNTTIAVADAALADTTTAQATVNGTEGNALSNVVIATFDDGNPSATAADFPAANISVSYTGSPTFIGTPSYQVVANGASATVSHWEVVATSVTFAEKGNYTASATVTDTDGSSVGPTANGPAFAIADAALTDTTTPQTTVNGTEGNSLSNVVIATFDDGNPSATAADFPPANIAVSYTGSPTFIGTPTYQVQANGSPSGGFSHWKVVATSVAFAEPGNYTASATVTDTDGSSVGPTANGPTFAIVDGALTDTTPSGSTAHAVEGNAFTKLVLMTFDDANPSATVSDFNVTSVTYTNSPSFTSVPTYQVQANGAPSGGVSHWEVVVSGTVAEPGNFTATVNVADSDGQTASTSNTTLAVADGALTDTTPSGSNANAVEGNSFTNLVLMTFDDANAAATVGDYTVTPVTYSGAPSFTSGPTYLVVANGVSGGVSHWKVEVTGTIAEKGNYTATVHVADTDGSTASSSNTTIAVADAALTDTTTAQGTVSGTEGNALGNVVIATFDDGNPSATAADFPAANISVSYTGSPTFIGTPSYQVVANGASATASHWEVVATSVTFAEKGNYTVSATVTDTDGSSVGPTAHGPTFAIADAALTDTTSPQTTVNGTEGNALSNVVIATFDDGNPSATAADFPPANISVSYTGSPTFIGTPTYQVQANGVSGGVSHWKVVATSVTFAEKGNYKASATVTDTDGSSVGPTGNGPTFAIADAALTDTTPSNNSASGVEGQSFSNVVLMTFDDANAFATAADFPPANITVTYTGGAAFSISPTYQVVANGAPSGGFSHWKVIATGTFSEEGNFGVHVTVADTDGSTASDSNTTFKVSDVAVVATAGPTINSVENGSTGLAVLATFTDPSGAEALAEYDATVAWGDGHTDNTTDAVPNVFILQPNPSGNLYVVEGIHTYGEEGSYSITTTVHHHSEVAPNPVDTVVNTQTAVVADQQLTNVVLNGANIPSAGLEGASIGAISNIATFTDPAGAEALGSYSAIVNWGDHTTSAGTIVSLGSGNFRVDAPAHTYVEEGTYTVTVTLQHESLAPVTTAGQSIAIVNQAASVTAFVGNNQSAAVGTAFSSNLEAQVSDALGDPVVGATVTFTETNGATGAGGTFAGNTTTVSATTNNQGLAIAPVLTANSTSGSFTVTASEGSLSATFNLTNVAAGAHKLVFANVPATAVAGQNFGFQVDVEDSFGNLVTSDYSQVTVSLSGPGSFTGGSTTVQAVAGLASFNAMTIQKVGSYMLSVADGSLVTPPAAPLAVTVAAPSLISAAAGTPQTTTVGQAYSTNLAVLVTDAFGNPENGVSVTFVAPTTGASGSFGGSATVTTGANGIATAPTFTANGIPGSFVVTASAGALSANFNLANLVGAPNKLVIVNNPGTITAGVGFSLQVDVEDSFGNIVTGNSASVSLSGPTFTSGTTTVTASNGVANFNGLAIQAAGTYTLTATDTTDTLTKTGSLTVTAGVPGLISATAGTTPQTATVGTAYSQAPAVLVTDAFGNPENGVAVTFSAPATGASGTFASSSTVSTGANGIATAPTFTANGVPGSFVVTASTSGLSTNFNLTNLVGSPNQLAIVNNPSTITAGLSFSLQVDVEDSFGNIVTGNTASITLSGATFTSGATTVSASNGVASFNGLAVQAAGSYTLTATDTTDTLSKTAGLVVTAATPSLISDVAGTTPQTATVGTAYANALAVLVTDAFGNPENGVSVSFSAPGLGASGTFAASSTVPTGANGIATAPAFTANGTPGSFVVSASAGALSTGFNLTNLVGSPHQVVIVNNPGTIPAGVGFSLQADVEDSFGNIVTGNSGSVTLSGAPFTSGATTVTASNGVASFNGLVIQAASSAPYTLTATDTTDGNLTGTASLTVTTATSSSLSVTAGTTPQTAVVGTAYGQALAVLVADAFGNPESGVFVTFTAPITGASGTFASSSTVVSGANGIATAPTFTANGAPGSFVVTASAGALSTSFNLTNLVGSANKLVIVNNPGTVTAGVGFSLQVDVEDSFGNIVTGNSASVSLSGATFTSGTTTVTASNGVASFNGLAIRTAGTYTLTATDTSDTLTKTGSLTVTAGVPSLIAPAAGTPQSAVVGQPYGTNLAVLVSDAFGNPENGVSVTFTPPATGASGSFAGSATVTTGTNGMAAAPVFTANGVPGSFVVAANAGALATSFNLTNLVGPVNQLAFLSNPGTVAAGVGFSMQVAVEDSFGNIETGNTDSVSLIGPFTSGATTISAVNGVASFTGLAIQTAGTYSISAHDGGIIHSAILTVHASAPSIITPTAGTTPQSATVGTAYANNLAVLVTDAFGNTESNVSVTFTAPSTGASGGFGAGNAATDTENTNSSGIATAQAFTANALPGSYLVTASAGSLTANFNLTNWIGTDQINTPVAANLPAGGLEGAPVSAITGIATFTDPAGAEPLGNYSATINWGDNSTSTGTVLNTGGNSFRVDAPAHTYAEDSAYNVTVIVQHGTLPPVTSNTQSISIADQQITNLTESNLPATGLEGQALAPILGIATFTDPAGLGFETTADYTATINWDDATQSTGQVVALGGGTYRVDAPAHTYTADRSYHVTVSVQHDSEPLQTSNVQTISIADQQLDNLGSNNLPLTALEGVGVPAITGIATFTDPGGPQPLNDYSATINWGDGTSTGTVVNIGGNNFRVDAPAHPYTEEGIYTVTVTLTHEGLPSLITPTQSIVVADQQITGLAATNLPMTGLEGAPVGAITGIASFTDPAGAEAVGDYAATINWGDNSTSVGTVVNVSGNNFSVNAPTHTYLQEGSYNVTVTIKHDALAAVTSNVQSIFIADQPISNLVAANLPSNGNEGSALAPIVGIATFTDPAGAEAAADYATVINWGDGTTSPGTVVNTSGNNFTVNAPAHTYVEEGMYLVTVTVTHDALAAVTSNSQSVIVGDQPITNLVGANLPATGVEGVSLPSILSIATFADPAGVGLETSADFTATINWGDMTGTSPGQVVSLGGGNYRVDAPAHTYADEGTYNVTVTVQHDSLPAANTSTQTIVVSDPAVVATPTPFSTIGNQFFMSQTLATFTDPAGPELMGGLADPSEYSASIDWGDNSGTNGTIVYNGDGSFSVQGSHMYAIGTYLAKVTVNHGTAPSTTVTTVISVVSGPASQLVIVNNPSSVAAGQFFNFQVDVEDQFNNLVTGNSSQVTVMLGGPGGFTSGSTTVQALGGIATFTGMSIQQAGSYNLSASQGALSSMPVGLTVTPGTSSRIVTVQGGSGQSATVGNAYSPFSVLVTDAYGNPVTGASVTFTAPTTGAGGTFTGGSNTDVETTNSSGMTSSQTLTANHVAGAFHVSVAVAGSSGATVSLTNLPGTATQLAFPATVSAPWPGLAIPSFQVAVEDQYFNVVTTDSSMVSLTPNGPGPFTSGVSTQQAKNGIATFSGLVLQQLGAYTLTATDGTLTPAFSNSFTLSLTPVQISPTGETAGALPTFTWGAVGGADHYDLWVDDLTSHQSMVIRNMDVVGTSFTATKPLVLGDNYEWWIDAINTNGTHGPWSAGLTFSLAALNAPVLVGPSGSITSQTPTFTWNAVAGAANYEILVIDQTVGRPAYDNANIGAVTSFALPAGAALVLNHNYVFYMRAFTSTGAAGFFTDQGLHFTITQLPAPTLIGPTGQFLTPVQQPTFTWSAVPGADHYELYIGNSAHQQVYDNTNVPSNTFVLPTPLPLGDTYKWFVRAFNSSNSGGIWGNPLSFTLPALGAPSLIGPSGNIPGSTMPTFSWTSVTGADHYELYIQDRTTGQNPVFDDKAVMGTSLTLTSPLASGHQYRWWIQAIDSTGKGTWSSFLEFTT